MNWDCEILIEGSNPVILSCSFNSQLLAIDLSSANRRDTWYRAGFLQSLINLDGQEFLGNKFTLGFGGQLIEIPYLNYQLQFEPREWLLNTTIKIKQLSTLEIKAITTMYVNSNQTVARETGSPIYTTVTPAQANAAVPVFLIAAPRARRSVLITNKTNKTLYIKEGAAASAPTLVAADPFVSIVSAASYTIEDWSGEIVGLMAANFQAGGKIIVKELPYAAPETADAPQS
jgi:hypothetical protein